ncbi:MAG: S1-C subfamily serine protease/antitoxin component YwqK of YwqJK toxin-antitoxin module [Glaciecola sp.]|jgi:S1-C subfamily serine protease/antitoxin component YwqK of YwqJK toxin-antitoxin module
MVQKLALFILFVGFSTSTQCQKVFFNRVGEATTSENSYYYRASKGGQQYSSFYSSNDNKFFKGGIQNANELTEKNNLYFGKCVWYYKNGNTKREVEYNNEGKESGSVTEYFENGKVSSEAQYKNGQVINNKYVVYDEEGNSSVLFKEEFKNNSNDWDLYSSDNGSATIEDNKLILESQSKLGASRFISFYSEAKAYSIELKLNVNKLKGGSKAGLIYGFKDWNNYNFYLISKNSFYIGSVYEGITTYQMEGMYSYDITTESSNRLKLLTENGKTVFSINGSIQYSGDEYSFKGSNLGAAVSGKNLVVVEHVIFKELNSSSNSALSEDDENFKASGSGFIINKNGYVLTNYHVIEDAKQVVVEISTAGDTKKYDAEVVQSDKINDLAIIKLTGYEEKKIQYAFKSSGSEGMGAEIFTLGYPLALNGMGKSVKFVDGKISSKTGYKGAINSYQMSIPVQPGNSGGPVFNKKGEVIGVVNAKISGADNVSYAIKINYAKNLIDLLPDDASYPSDKNSIANVGLESKIKKLKSYVVLIKIK